MPDYRPWLEALPAMAQEKIPLLRTWCSLSTPSLGEASLSEFALRLQKEFSPWVDDSEILALAPWESVDAQGVRVEKILGPALRCFRRRQAPLRVFLGIHTDVVYGGDPEQQGPPREENGRLYAPGAADAKGGIIVMLLALEAFEKSPWASHVGFEILLNPDEEIGSPGSLPLLQAAALRNHLGLLFEPALPDGGLVSARKGSANFTALFRGRSGHAGRDNTTGRNALHAAAEFIVALSSFAAGNSGITVNVGRVDGGGPVNRIADLGIARFNVRVEAAAQMDQVRKFLDDQEAAWKRREGFSLEIQGGFASPPKPLQGASALLLEQAIRCGQELGLNLKASPSGGVCDGNKLAAAGLPNLDTLGPVGGGLHGNGEWVLLDSLAERSALTALLLMKLASGEIEWKVSA